ncbi:ATP-binding protein [[Clostridium] scindens]|uniref:ATP-binding protein n=1 Tax=Clostridium scindens (strain JCM 10418 / VPI 12708) TaxID=29347 RepID=UPI001570E321|nr:ATP-binding protein [[Clostridium] scindens]NSI90780.1 DNA mismatch repair protein [[Clostridium] scindens]NSJ05396.1 DNA mismatch repair protein [[Clostridium] scindens]
MAKDIFVIKTMGDALRNTGYKNIECAMAEIIDNSVQADAQNILIIVSEEYNPRTGRNNISEIAFLDDGSGMSNEEIEGCLGIGYSTRTDRKGMGRFGVGLPQASLYACPAVDVYSWQGGYDNCKKVFLDINKIKSEEQTEIEDPIFSEIPEKYKKYLTYKVISNEGDKKYDFTQHGTFVIWKNCDRVIPKTVNFLFKKLDFALGQKFRYFISEGKSSIRLIHHENQDYTHEIMPNDPLMLMPNNYVLGNPENPGVISPRTNIDCTVPVFEVYTNSEYPDGIIPYPIKYADPETGETKESQVEIKFSIVKNIFYDKTAISGNPGQTQLGKHVKELEGISIVRANREIDFGQFDFYENVNQPEHRWWGCEIRFNPELDEAFGVANNKQHVELRRVEQNDYIDEEVKPVWAQLYDIIHDTISAMYAANKKTRENARTVKDITPPTTQIINSAEENQESTPGSATDEARENTPHEKLVEKTKEQLKEQGIENPTEEDVNSYMNNKVNVVHKNLGKTAGLFDYSFELGSCLVTFNMDHIFYKTTLCEIFESIDTKTAFELFVASLVKAVDETKMSQEEQNDNLIAIWNEKLRRYINEQQSYAKK